MATNTISKFGCDYLQLGLRIGKRYDQYVDYYYGPPEIEIKVNKEPIKSPNLLLEECSSLQKRVSNQGFEDKRVTYLEKMIDSMELFIKTEFLDEEIPIEEILRIQCDTEIRPYHESELSDLKDQFEEFYCGKGTLEERVEALRVKRCVPQEEVYDQFKKGNEIARSKTVELFPDMLPKGETIELNKISSSEGVNWISYDWYKGKFRSVVDVRTDHGMYWTSMLRVCSHECYPGHHTQFAVAEDKLFNDQNHFERAILQYCTPYMIICEGIANLSLNAIFSARKQEEIALNTFCPDPENGPTVELLMKQNQARKKLPMIDFNAAYHAQVDGWEKKEVRNFIKSFELWDSKNLDNKINMIYNPLFKLSGYAYQIGTQLIVEKYGEYPSPKDFRFLIENPVLPSDLA